MLWSYGAAFRQSPSMTILHRPICGRRNMKAMPQTFTVEPATDFYTIENSVRTSPRGSEEKPAVVREPGSRLVRLGGSLPVGAQPRHLTIAMRSPRICRRVARAAARSARRTKFMAPPERAILEIRRLRARMVQRRPSWPGARPNACREIRHVTEQLESACGGCCCSLPRMRSPVGSSRRCREFAADFTKPRASPTATSY